jgi:aspartate-semialdehyde dehydrogenase
MILGVIGVSLLTSEILTVSEVVNTCSVRCFDDEVASELEGYFRDSTIDVEPLLKEDLADCDVLICATNELSDSIRQYLITGNVKVIDACNSLLELPLIHPIYTERQPKLHKVRLPHTNAAHLLSVLAPLVKSKNISPLSMVVDTIFEPASSVGTTGLDELWQQGIAIHNHQGSDVEYFSTQLAYNCIPFGHTPNGSEGAIHEEQLIDEVCKLCDISNNQFALQMVRVPVFSATCHSLMLFFEHEQTLGEVVKVLNNEPLFDLSSADIVTPLTSGEGACLTIGRSRQISDRMISLWLVANNLRVRAQLAFDLACSFIDVN